jgi:hypothetical protein
MSGSAQNAGANFQARVTAWFLAKLYLSVDVSQELFGYKYDNDLILSEVASETTSIIDDLYLKCTNNSEFYIQIKRTVQLSKTESSDFYKALDQFIQRFIEDNSSDEYYVLATSPSSSTKIVQQLAKYFKSVKLNDARFGNNPLNKTEKETVTVFRDNVRKLFKKYAKKRMPDELYIKFCKGMLICKFDIESGGIHEQMATLLLSSKTNLTPTLVWSRLLVDAIDFASGRLSVNVAGIKNIVDNFVNATKNSSGLSMFLSEEPLPAGKEVLLIDAIKGQSSEFINIILTASKSKLDNVDYLIVELFRFDDGCHTKVSFKDDNCILGDGTTKLPLIYRAATQSGLIRLLEEHEDLLLDKKLLIIPASQEIDEVENTACAKVHSRKLTDLINTIEDLYCLHCGKPLTAKMQCVEIDEIGLNHVVGYVHNPCLRPTDRVLGQVKYEFLENFPFLENFDINKWVAELSRGQSLFTSMSKNLPNIRIMGWNPPKTPSDNVPLYCVWTQLEDGSIRYSTTRHKVDRFSEEDALMWVDRFNSMFKQAEAENDPVCYTSIHFSFARYSRLLGLKEENEECLRCVQASLKPYTNLISLYHDSQSHFYAPLCLVKEQNSGKIVVGGGCVFMLTNPLELEKYASNWRRAGIEITKYELVIIENDDTFDAYMWMFRDDGLAVIVDPIVDLDFNPVKGIIIRSQMDILAEAQS